ncbi:MAG: hypothetical protein ACKVQS_03825 [Fimbriimonadaceae bacterium]
MSRKRKGCLWSVVVFIGVNIVLATYSGIENARMVGELKNAYAELGAEAIASGGEAGQGRYTEESVYLEVSGDMAVPRKVFERWEKKYLSRDAAMVHVTDYRELTTFTSLSNPLPVETAKLYNVEVKIVTVRLPLTFFNVFDAMP